MAVVERVDPRQPLTVPRVVGLVIERPLDRLFGQVVAAGDQRQLEHRLAAPPGARVPRLELDLGQGQVRLEVAGVQRQQLLPGHLRRLGVAGEHRAFGRAAVDAEPLVAAPQRAPDAGALHGQLDVEGLELGQLVEHLEQVLFVARLAQAGQHAAVVGDRLVGLFLVAVGLGQEAPRLGVAGLELDHLLVDVDQRLGRGLGQAALFERLGEVQVVLDRLFDPPQPGVGRGQRLQREDLARLDLEDLLEHADRLLQVFGLERGHRDLLILLDRLALVAELERDGDHLVAQVLAVGLQRAERAEDPALVLGLARLAEQQLVLRGGLAQLGGRLRVAFVAELLGQLGQQLGVALARGELLGVEVEHAGQGHGRHVGVAGLVAAVGVGLVAAAGLGDIAQRLGDLADPPRQVEVGQAQLFGAQVAALGALELAAVFELLAQGQQVFARERDGVAVLLHLDDHAHRHHVGGAHDLEQLFDRPLPVEAAHDLAEGGVLLFLGGVGLRGRRVDVLHRRQHAPDLAQLLVAPDRLARQVDGAQRHARLQVLGLEDVERRLTPVEVAVHAIPGEQLEDLFGDLVGQRLLHVGLEHGAHAHQDLAQPQPMAGSLLPLERGLELLLGQLAPLEQRLAQQGLAAVGLEQLDGAALEVDVLHPAVVAVELERAGPLLLHERSQDVGQVGVVARAGVGDGRHWRLLAASIPAMIARKRGSSRIPSRSVSLSMWLTSSKPSFTACSRCSSAGSTLPHRE